MFGLVKVAEEHHHQPVHHLSEAFKKLWHEHTDDIPVVNPKLHEAQQALLNQAMNQYESLTQHDKQADENDWQYWMHDANQTYSGVDPEEAYSYAKNQAHPLVQAFQNHHYPNEQETVDETRAEDETAMNHYEPDMNRHETGDPYLGQI